MDNNTVLLKQIISEGFNKRIDDVLSERMESIECSKKHSEVMRAIVEGRVTGNIVWTTKMRRVVALLVAALLLLTGCAVAYREEIFSFIKKSTDIAVEYRADHADKTLNEVEEIYVLTYIPDGYFLTESVDLTVSIYNTYTNDEGKQLIFTQTLAASSKPSMSNENTTINYHTVKNYEVIEVISDINFIYNWNNKQYIMKLISVDQVSLEDIELIMDGIVVKE